MQLSNAAFNHQSMSFKLRRRSADEAHLLVAQFLADVEHVAVAAPTSRPQCRVFVGERRKELKHWRAGATGRSVDHLTTVSQPHVVIRELRPYMYWLRFFRTGREAGELDWDAIGGTWGVATSRPH